jgi:hypothetical protein
LNGGFATGVDELLGRRVVACGAGSMTPPSVYVRSEAWNEELTPGAFAHS